MTTTQVLGLDCVRLANEALSLLVTQSVGPRILALQLSDGPNIFAELPGLTINCPDVGPFHLWGGHRLWHAPEVSRRTYLPDDQPVEIVALENGLRVTQPVEAQTGLQKSWQIQLPDESATVIIEHTFTNHSLWPIECAPWAITQLKPGGTAILPQFRGTTDADGLQPNRALALWPYTDMNSPHISWGNRYIFVKANMTEGAIKIGWPNRRGWLAYHWQETLFVKYATFDRQATYYDLNSSSQCYCNADFLELETLAPRTTIQPNASVTHREVWKLFAPIAFEASEERVEAIVEELSLE